MKRVWFAFLLISLLTPASNGKNEPAITMLWPAEKPALKLTFDKFRQMGTPVIVRFTLGTHQLDLVKEGYAPGATPLEVTADELPGESVTVELGGLSRDTVELRDGSIVLGDVISMSMTEIVVRVGGKDQAIDRNQVKKVMLVERMVTQQPAVTQPAAAQPHP
jgi:hypothetical protein